MASSTSGPREPNRKLWLATRAGKMALSRSLGISTRSVPQTNSVLFHVLNQFFDQRGRILASFFFFFLARLWAYTYVLSLIDNYSQKYLYNCAALQSKQVKSLKKTTKIIILFCRRLLQAENFEWGSRMKNLRDEISRMKIKSVLNDFKEWREGKAERTFLNETSPPTFEPVGGEGGGGNSYIKKGRRGHGTFQGK